MSCCALNVHEHCCRSVRHLGLELASLQYALHELDGVSTGGDRHREHKRERERKADEMETAPEEVSDQPHTAGDPDMIGFFGEKRSRLPELDPGFFDEEKRGANEAGVGPGFFGDEKRSANGAEMDPGFFPEKKRLGASWNYGTGFFDEDKRGGRGLHHELEPGFFPEEVRKRLAAGRTFHSEPGFFGDSNEEKRKLHHHGLSSHHKKHRIDLHSNTVVKQL